MAADGAIRRLAPSEETFARGEIYIGYSVSVSGDLDTDALVQAFDAVVRRYPILAAHLEPIDGGHVLVKSSEAMPVISIVDGDPDKLLTGAKIDQRAALGSLCVVRDGKNASVTLMTHHGVADARFSVGVLEKMWSFYDAAANGHPIEVDSTGFPSPIEDLLTDRGIVKIPNPAAESQERPGTREPQAVVHAPGNETIEYAQPRTARHKFTKEFTEELVNIGHRENVTVNGLVSSAILRAESAIRNVRLSELIYGYAIDLRTRVNPPVGETEGSNVQGFVNYIPAEKVGPRLLDLASSICTTLKVELDGGIWQQMPLHISDMMGAEPPEIPGFVASSNWGALPEICAPDSLRVEDFRSTMITKPHRSGDAIQKSGTYVISTFNGQLSIEFHYWDEHDNQHQTRINRVASQLHDAAAATSGT